MTAPIPIPASPTVNVSISDPVSADIQAVCGAVLAVFTENLRKAPGFSHGDIRRFARRGR